MLVQELTPGGSIVGRIAASDPNGDALSGWTWASRDPTDPNAFTINSATGDVTVTRLLDTTITLKTSYSYTVSVSDGRLTTTGAILITIQVVYRPPVTFAQTRSVSEAATGGSDIPPALDASHPQSLPLTFSVSDPSATFDVNPSTGVLYLRVGKTLNFVTQKLYALVLRVTDSQGGQATASLTVQVTEVNKVPFFPGGSSAFQTDATVGGRPGIPLAVNIKANDLNVGDALTYQWLTSDPPAGATTFDINPTTGDLVYGAALVPGNFSFDWSSTFTTPATYRMTFRIIDSGVPRMSITGSISIFCPGVSPFIVASQTFVMNGAATAGTSVGQVAARSAYSPSNLRFSLVSCDRTPSNQNTFVVSSSGALSVATPQPTWNYNTQPTVNCRVAVSDTAPYTGVSYGNIMIALTHVNRPPAWLTVPTLYAASSRSGFVGQPMSGFIDDPDTRLPVGERLTFAIAGGNTGGTMGIDAATGQIFVANNATSAIQYNSGASVFNLQVNVTDAGIDGPPYWSVTTIRIEVVYANNPPGPLLGPFRYSVGERSPAGTVIGYFDATDFDANDMLRYSLAPAGANVNRPFSLNITTVPGGPFGRNRGMITVIEDGWWPEAGATFYSPMDYNLKVR